MLQEGRWMVTEAHLASWGRLETKPPVIYLQNQCSGMDASSAHCPSGTFVSLCWSHITAFDFLGDSLHSVFSGTVAISWGFQDCLAGGGVLMGKKQSFIPWYLLSSKLIQVGCNSCAYLKQALIQCHTQVWETVSCETFQTSGRVVQTILVKSKLVGFQ